MNRYKKQFASAFILGIGLLLFVGSLSEKVVLEERMVPRFEYTPEEAPGLGSADLTISLISPNYARGITASAEPFYSFKKSLEAEMMELLTQRGYSVRGPFRSIDEMLYSDKEASHLAISISIEPIFDWVAGGWREVEVNGGGKGYIVKEGIGRLYGKLNLLAIEPISGERMWAKSVSIPEQRTKEFSSYYVYGGRGDVSSLTSLSVLCRDGDNNVSNALTEVFQATFDDIMNQTWRHLDPAEFERLKPKIEQLKAG